MLSRSTTTNQRLISFINRDSAVLLISPDSSLASELQQIFSSLGLHVETIANEEAALNLLTSLQDSRIVLLDARLAGVANGRLLAAMQESGAHKKHPIALIAEYISDEWIARLREGVIDDIVPRGSDAAVWSAHLSTMRRGHALYCELERLRETSLTEVQHDRITGTFNRAAMLTLLFRETDRVQRLRGSLCLVLFDIDDFSHWNRELGPDVCDELLREIAERTGKILRSYDLLGRTGRDEFLLALPGCSTVNAMMTAERLRIDVFGEPFEVKDSMDDARIRLTACYAVVASFGRSPVVVVREAERTLAWAKQSGPESIRCASESPVSDESSSGLTTLFPETGALV